MASSKKPLPIRCFFDVTISGDVGKFFSSLDSMFFNPFFVEHSAGRIVLELFNDVCPKTCENFRSLCAGDRGVGKVTGKPLTYKDVPFHRIVKDFIVQSGDFSSGRFFLRDFNEAFIVFAF